MKWMFCPSIVVVNCGIALSCFSAARQSYPDRQWFASVRSHDVGTPVSQPSPGSGAGHRVASSFAASSSSAACGTSMRKGRISSVSVTATTLDWT
jgi:hypothetical protein